jgi:hypothetical protein
MFKFLASASQTLLVAAVLMLAAPHAHAQDGGKMADNKTQSGKMADSKMANDKMTPAKTTKPSAMAAGDKMKASAKPAKAAPSKGKMSDSKM